MIGLGIGVPIAVIGGVILTFFLSSPNPDTELASIETRELPEAWLQEPLDEPSPSEATVPDAVPEEAAAPSLENLGLPIHGTLVMRTNDRPFGEETFQLALEGDRAILSSTGTFWLRALVATITVSFNQILSLDSQLCPQVFSSNFDAPLGFSRDMQAEFEETQAVIHSGDDVTEFSVAVNRAVVLGTFSTYAIVPLLYELRQLEGIATFDVLVFGGPPNQDEEDAGQGLPEMRVQKIDDGIIRFDDQVLSVAQYQISGDVGDMTLYARGVELLGLHAGNGDESLFVYRADYFENGFEVVEPVSSE